MASRCAVVMRQIWKALVVLSSSITLLDVMKAAQELPSFV